MLFSSYEKEFEGDRNFLEIGRSRRNRSINQRRLIAARASITGSFDINLLTGGNIISRMIGGLDRRSRRKTGEKEEGRKDDHPVDQFPATQQR